MQIRHPFFLAGTACCLVAASLLAGCGSSDSGSGTGSLNLQITDGPVDEAEQVVIEFTGVEIKTGSSTVDITYDIPKQIDLLALTGGVAEIIVVNQPLPAGQVEWIRLKVDEDNSYIRIAGNDYGLRIPSGSQTGLKLNRPITIREDATASFTIDFDLRKSVHEFNNGRYMLRPTLRLIDNQTDGALGGTVDTSTIAAECLAGDSAAVYVYSGDVTPNDIGSAIEPVSTAVVDWANAEYDYTVAFLPAGSYTVAFTCDAALDDPLTDDNLGFVGTTTVTVTAGQTADADF